MQIVKLSGGLGNQLFQYEYGKYLAQKYNDQVSYDASFYNLQNQGPTDKRNLELNKFNIDINLVDENEFPFLKLEAKDLLRYIIESLILRKYKFYNIFYESKYSFISRFLSLFFKNSVHIGYWQNLNYLSNLKYTLNANQPRINDSIRKKIIASNSVSIGVRRGDFVKLGEIVCDENYYKNAINIINRLPVEHTYFIFSDDIDWCKSNLKITNKHFFVDANKDTPFENMELMSLCNHNIISNSTYDWWGATLNENKNKVVVCPKYWTPKSNEIKKEIIPDQWVKI